jgi:amino acid transporter
LYHVLGQDVHLGSLVIGAGFAIGLAVLNSTGARATALAQEWVTYGRLLMMLLFLGIAIAWAEPANLQPLIPGASPGAQFGAFLGVLGTAPFWYAGFNVAATAAEESGTSMRTAGRAVVIAVLAAAAFYIALVLAVSAMVPRSVLVTLDLPAAQAFEVAMGSPTVARLVLATAILGNLTAWNALLMAGSRVFFALGRAQLSPAGFARLGPASTPVTGILILTLVTLAVLPLGRGFILPIVNLTSACFAITYLITCLALLKLRRSGNVAAFTAPGGNFLVAAAAVSSVGIFLVAVIQPWLAGPDVPAEALALAGWMAFAGVLWLAMRRSILAVPHAVRAPQLRGDLVDEG